MNRKTGVIAVILMCVLLSGCKFAEEEKPLRAVDYTVVGKDEMPEELQEQIETEKAKEFQLSYNDGEYLYIAKGYGEQAGIGYQIAVESLHLTEHTLVFDTQIFGPTEESKQGETSTMPYIVVKTEAMDQQIIYK